MNPLFPVDNSLYISWLSNSALLTSHENDVARYGSYYNNVQEAERFTNRII
jgi:hypothetical protein